MNKQLGERLKMLRHDSNISQDVLSTKTGISRSNISKIESGTISPTANTIILLAQFFNVSSDFLLFGQNCNKTETDRLHSTSSEKELTNDEKELLNLWRGLSYMNKAIIKGELYKLKKEQEQENSKYNAENLMVAE